MAELSSTSLAFVANLNGNWDLFRVDENGRNVRRLTATPYDENEPSWSSDRTQIVYTTSDGQLNIINIHTKAHNQLSVKNRDVSKTIPAFSPTAKRVAFVTLRPGSHDNTHLMIFNLETKVSSNVLYQHGPQSWPSWSPDGRRLVYTYTHCAAHCGQIIQELWIADPEGGYARQLLMTNSHCQQPAWSPDGKRIAFASDKSGNFDVWVLSLEDWKLEQVTTDKNLDVSPAWSPEGNRLAFVSTRSGTMGIWIKDLNTGELKQLKPFRNKDVEIKDVAW